MALANPHVLLYNDEDGVCDFVQAARQQASLDKQVHDGHMTLYGDHARDRLDASVSSKLAAITSLNTKGKLLLADAGLRDVAAGSGATCVTKTSSRCRGGD